GLHLAGLDPDGVVDVWIVAHCHDYEAAFGLLDTDAIKAVAVRPRRAHRDVDEFGRRLVELEGAKAALVRGAVGAVLDDLPMTARHSVLAHEQRLARQHAHAPVELGR